MTILTLLLSRLVVCFQRRQRSDHTTLSCAKALKKAPCESIETPLRIQRLFFAGAVARQNEGRLSSRVMFATMTGGVSPETGRTIEDMAEINS